MDAARMVPVATGLADFEAKLVAAQLGAEGIVWQTRGIVDSVCPFGAIDVLVAAEQVDEARQVLALGAGDDDPHHQVRPVDALGARAGVGWRLGLVAAGLAAAFAMARMFVYL